ncbi:MAG: diaminopimelate decarboxylase [Chlorobi bacterium CHB2]|nr:diaminopimelate decarboxylase [Chlorobi bacterium CHB2]
MVWEAEFTDEFAEWWDTLAEGEQDAIDSVVGVLQHKGPMLKEPLSKVILSSRHAPHMKELRISAPGGERLRVFYAFDPRRVAIILIGGNKTGRWKEFYDEYIPIADDLYDEHLRTIDHEGDR